MADDKLPALSRTLILSEKKILALSELFEVDPKTISRLYKNEVCYILFYDKKRKEIQTKPEGPIIPKCQEIKNIQTDPQSPIICIGHRCKYYLSFKRRGKIVCLCKSPSSCKYATTET